jgi:hypothetical protein
MLQRAWTGLASSVWPRLPHWQAATATPARTAAQCGASAAAEWQDAVHAQQATGMEGLVAQTYTPAAHTHSSRMGGACRSSPAVPPECAVGMLAPDVPQSFRAHLASHFYSGFYGPVP